MNLRFFFSFLIVLKHFTCQNPKIYTPVFLSILPKGQGQLDPLFPLKLLATKAATLALRAWEEPLKIIAHLQRFDYYSCPKSCGKSIIMPSVSPLIYSNTSPESLNSAVTLHDYTCHLSHKPFSPGMDQWEFSHTYNWAVPKRGFCLYKNTTQVVLFGYKSYSSKGGSSDPEGNTSLWRHDHRAQCTRWKPIPEESFNAFYKKGHFPKRKNFSGSLYNVIVLPHFVRHISLELSSLSFLCLSRIFQ